MTLMYLMGAGKEGEEAQVEEAEGEVVEEEEEEPVDRLPVPPTHEGKHGFRDWHHADAARAYTDAASMGSIRVRQQLRG